MELGKKIKYYRNEKSLRITLRKEYLFQDKLFPIGRMMLFPMPEGIRWRKLWKQKDIFL